MPIWVKQEIFINKQAYWRNEKLIYDFFLISIESHYLQLEAGDVGRFDPLFSPNSPASDTDRSWKKTARLQDLSGWVLPLAPPSPAIGWKRTTLLTRKGKNGARSKKRSQKSKISTNFGWLLVKTAPFQPLWRTFPATGISKHPQKRNRRFLSSDYWW